MYFAINQNINHHLQFFRDKQFELAVTLLTSQPVVDQQKVNQLKEWHAFDLFCQVRFRDFYEFTQMMESNIFVYFINEYPWLHIMKYAKLMQ